MIIAQLSDPHLVAEGTIQQRIDPRTKLSAAIDSLLKVDPLPDIVLLTGDLAQLGKPEGYAKARELLARLPMPVYVIPGNQDNRQNMREAFAQDGYLPKDGEFLHYVIEDHELRLIGVDSTRPGGPGGGGLLCEERLSWLEERLCEAPDRQTLIFMHHPPFRTGLGKLDKEPMPGGDAMAEIVAQHPQVKKVLAGHIHRYTERVWAGTAAATAPAIAFQVTLTFDRGASATWHEEPAPILFHLWHDEEEIITHSLAVGDYEGPFEIVRQRGAK